MIIINTVYHSAVLCRLKLKGTHNFILNKKGDILFHFNYLDTTNECRLMIKRFYVNSSLTVTKLEKRKDIHKFQITTKQSLKKDITYQVEILFDGTLGSDSSSPFYQSTYSNSKHSQQKKSAVINFQVWLYRCTIFKQTFLDGTWQ